MITLYTTGVFLRSKAGSQFKFELQRPSLDENTWKSEPRLVNSTGEKHWPGNQHEVYKQSCVTEGFVNNRKYH